MNHFHPDYHDEDEIEKAYDSRLMRRLLIYLKPYRMAVVGAIVLLLVGAGLRQVGPYLTKIAIDVHIVGKNVAGLNRIVLIFIAVHIAQFIVMYLQSYITQMVGQRVMSDLRMEIFSHLQKLSLRFFDHNPVGRLMMRATGDVQVLNEMVTSGVVTVFGDVFTLIAIVAMMLKLDVRLALVTFSVLPALIYATMLFRRKVRQAYRQIRVRIARINAFLQENIGGMEVVQLFGREKKNAQRFNEINRSHTEAQLRTVFYYAIFFPAVELIAAVATALIIWYGGLRVTQHTLTIGVLVAFIQYVGRFFWPMRNLAEKYNILQAAMASSERIFDLLDTEEEIRTPPSPRRLDQVNGHIEFRHVWFAYNAEEDVLKDVSFEVQPGESMAIVGATGSGKTTLINLLCRFYDVQRGGILLDDIDIRELDKYELRRRIGVVQQDVFLFAGTISDNIHLGSKDISPERVREVAAYVNADHFIDRLPNGYDEKVQERGLTLSTGQRQLLSFARALAFQPDILVLDEATSSVDTETEMLIQDAIAKLMQGRTSIIIAHRLSTIQHADRIVVLHKGTVREIGTHQELLHKGDIYYRLYQLQYKGQALHVA